MRDNLLNLLLAFIVILASLAGFAIFQASKNKPAECEHNVLKYRNAEGFDTWTVNIYDFQPIAYIQGDRIIIEKDRCECYAAEIDKDRGLYDPKFGPPYKIECPAQLTIDMHGAVVIHDPCNWSK